VDYRTLRVSQKLPEQIFRSGSRACLPLKYGKPSQTTRPWPHSAWGQSQKHEAKAARNLRWCRGQDIFCRLGNEGKTLCGWCL